MTSKRAAEYVRMSTEHQQYSTLNQQGQIRKYAQQHGFEVVETFVDQARSGLRLTGRPGLQALLAKVVAGTDDFDFILVFDVSRWGRFQDIDEAAHYEFLCRKAGKPVIYCAEAFNNDGTPWANIVKGLKRVMAGEYSRELSEKVLAGQARLVEMGFKAGGRPGYGLRRQLVDRAGQPRGYLQFGERKAVQTDRVKLVQGPALEVEVVKNIYRWFVEDKLLYGQIVARLEHQGVPPPPGMKWNKYVVKTIIGNEKYRGEIVFNKVSTRLASPRQYNAPEKWVHHPNALPGIVPDDLFALAAARKAGNPRRIPDDELLASLKALHAQHGYLSQSLVTRSPGMPSTSTYADRFVTASRAFELAGFAISPRHAKASAFARQTRRYTAQLALQLADELRNRGGKVVVDENIVTLSGVQVALLAVCRKARAVPRVVLHRSAALILVVFPHHCRNETAFRLLTRAEFAGASLAFTGRRCRREGAETIWTIEEAADCVLDTVRAHTVHIHDTTPPPDSK